MPISATCPNTACGEALEVDDLDAGAEVVCPWCETAFTAPTSAEADAFETLLRACGQGYTAYADDTQIARGGMGAILQCKDRALGRQVAVKVMHPNVASEEDGRLRFLEEAQITGQLEHPNIVPVHELGEDDGGNLFFTMKLVHGRSLGQQLEAMRADSADMTLTELLNIFLKVCDGVAFAHSKQVIHRDLKPDNIMLGDFGEVLVMDWGIAKVIGSRRAQSKRRQIAEIAERPMVTSVRGDTQLTQYGAVAGTPAYMPPEQARGELDKIDTRSDIYSLGAILYELLTLRPPIDGKSAAQVLIKVQKGDIIAPELRTPQRRVPRELSAVCMKALHRTRSQRYQNVGELAQDIRLFLEGRAVSAKDDSFVESITKLVKRNKAVTVSAAVALAVIAVMGVISVDRVRTQRDLALAAQEEQLATATRASKRFAMQAIEAAEYDRTLEANRRAEDAEAVAPGGVWGHYVRGKLAAIRGDFEAAKLEMEKAAALATPEMTEIQAAAAIQARGGEIADAEALLANLADVDDWRTLASAGQALYETGRFAECQPLLQRALELAPADAPKDLLLELKDLLDFAPAREACIGLTEATKHLPHRQRIARLQEKLVEINDGIDLRLILSPPDEPVRKLEIHEGTNDVHHIYPVVGLDANGANLDATKIRDLTPLAGMALTTLRLRHTRVRRLDPLQGMPLTYLNITRTPVTDLSPLEGMPMQNLDCSFTKVHDLSPLAGAPLERLWISETRVQNLEPLGGAPIRLLHMAGAPITDISAVASLKQLTNLHCDGRIRDLSPLKGLGIKEFRHTGARGDLSPLLGLPLLRADLTYGSFTNVDFLRGAPIEELQLSHGSVSDISALANAPLRVLSLSQNPVTDISALTNMPLESLHVGGCPIEDLTPLATLTKINEEECPRVPFLAGKTETPELIEALRKIDPQVDFKRRANAFTVMKLYGMGQRDEAKRFLDNKNLGSVLPLLAKELR